MKKCKKMQNHTMWNSFGNAGDWYQFEIKHGSPLRPHHLYALIAYCDFTQFCTAFSETFRKMRFNESIESVNQRNRKFYFCSRYYYFRNSITFSETRFLSGTLISRHLTILR